MSTSTLNVLGSTIANAEHFTDSQKKDENFKHVSSIWTAQCKTFDQGLEQLALDQKKIHDVRGPLADWKPVVTDAGRFALRYLPTGRDYFPTSKAVEDMAVLGGVSSWQLADLLANAKTKNNAKGEEKELYKRDSRDADVVCRLLQISLFAADRNDQQKTRLFRTWDDGTLRAVLSEQYSIVNNQWYLEVLRELIPGGLLSHWRGDADTIFGNVLIPDSIREESDSHYGGMLSIGNSEIGLRRIMSLPSVFRAICMNGCIWEQEKGQAVSKVHRGSVDFEQLKRAIAQNLQAQIPLLSNGINELLGTRALKMGDAPTVNVIAQFFNDYKLQKSLAPRFFKHWATEVDILGTEVRSAFGLQAALTRAGQELDNDNWVKFDMIAGQLSRITPNRWEGLVNRAKTLQKADIESVLGDVSHLTN